MTLQEESVNYNLMYLPSLSEFKKIARAGFLIPIYREIMGDLETPVSAFLKISQGEKGEFLLESVEGGEILGRYSFIGFSPRLVFRVKEGVFEIEEREEKIEKGVTKEPLQVLKNILEKFPPLQINSLPRFFGGAVGYISYDSIRYWEEIPRRKEDTLNLPDMEFFITDRVIIFDHVENKIKVMADVPILKDDSYYLEKAYEEAVKKIEEVIETLRKPLKHPVEILKGEIEEPISNFSPSSFMKAVEKCKKYIRAGDIFQVVISQRWSIPVTSPPFHIYRALRSLNPSPYMFYLNFGKFQLIGSSPEILVRKEGRKVILRPIAGTRPRGKNEREDSKLEKDLLKDPKELAEHIMLVDLGRNDLGRICDYGSVKVKELMVIERYSRVMHIVSHIEGKLRKDADQFQVLRASFPAGTVTGAPKIRAMEIIEELEPEERGPYAGAVGYFSYTGNLDSCITIRSILLKDGKAFLQAGAGIVADSLPEREYEETENKAKALREAVRLAEKGLEP